MAEPTISSVSCVRHSLPLLATSAFGTLEGGIVTANVPFMNSLSHRAAIHRRNSFCTGTLCARR
jgi:hypothetical protein